MDHGMGMTSMPGGGMMVPYLHFSGGDYLWLSVWAPSSRGEIAAACIGLFIMAILERLLAATRTMFDLHWRSRTLAIDSAGNTSTSYFATRAEKQATTSKSQPHVISDSSTDNIGHRTQESPSIPPRLPRLRTVPPFIAQHDIPRGILFAFQMFIGYLLMLAIMTFQAAYLISIVLGLGVGEILFGRVLRAGAGH